MIEIYCHERNISFMSVNFRLRVQQQAIERYTSLSLSLSLSLSPPLEKILK